MRDPAYDKAAEIFQYIGSALKNRWLSRLKLTLADAAMEGIEDPAASTARHRSPRKAEPVLTVSNVDPRRIRTLGGSRSEVFHIQDIEDGCLKTSRTAACLPGAGERRAGRSGDVKGPAGHHCRHDREATRRARWPAATGSPGPGSALCWPATRLKGRRRSSRGPGGRRPSRPAISAALTERDAARRQMQEWRQEFKLACGPSAACSSGSTGRTPGQRSRPRSGSSALLRRGNRQPGWRGRLPFRMSVIPAASPPRLASMAAATSRSVPPRSGSSGPVTPSSARSRSRAACRSGPWRFERCTMLDAAVRHARERANRAHADQVSVGVPVFAFLLGWADRGRAPRRPRHPESHGGNGSRGCPAPGMTEPGGQAARLRSSFLVSADLLVQRAIHGVPVPEVTSGHRIESMGRPVLEVVVASGVRGRRCRTAHG